MLILPLFSSNREMTGTTKIIDSFSKLGRAFLEASRSDGKPGQDVISDILPLAGEIDNCRFLNPWFIPEFVRLSFAAWAEALQEDKIGRWLAKYPVPGNASASEINVAIIMAGNLPLVGLHDLLCVLASGNKAIVKISSQDNRLIPAVVKLITEIDPELATMIDIREDFLRGFDAVIATGSNNTARYFDYYFGKYPSIIRKNRNSVAVITGKETGDELEGLSRDIFSYFGLGCRNVSKLYIPQDFDPAALFPAFREYEFLAHHNKYRNNYEYQKSIFIINQIHHFDNGFLLLREDTSLLSPVSVVNFERYDSPENLVMKLGNLDGLLQCIISADAGIPRAILPGTAQFPELWDYADGIDTMKFLTTLNYGDSSTP
jgi:hypothetical protein